MKRTAPPSARNIMCEYDFLTAVSFKVAAELQTSAAGDRRAPFRQQNAPGMRMPGFDERRSQLNRHVVETPVHYSSISIEPAWCL